MRLSNTFPDDLKVAGVTPIFKNGERNDLQNDRPIQFCVLLHGSLRNSSINNSMTI